MRGFGRVARTIKAFLEQHGYYVHLGAWVDVIKDGKLVHDLQIGTWFAYRHPKRGAKASLYLFTEGPIPRYAKEWLKEYEYLLAPSRFVAQQLEALDLPYILMPVGIDVSEFVPLGMPKFIDVMSVGIWESSWDYRKFMNKVCEIAFPFTCYVHTRSTTPANWMSYLYNMAKVYLSLSGAEGFNIPVLEANACGVPVVYNDAPATNEHAYGIGIKPKEVKEVEDRGYLLLIHVPDFEKIREVLHKLLNDEKTLEQLGREARQHALKYDYRETYKPLLEILR